MSRKHYVTVASLIAAEKAVAIQPETVQALDNLARSMADMFKQDNAAFDRGRFYAAAGVAA